MPERPGFAEAVGSWIMSTQPRAVVRLATSFIATAGLALASVVWSESWFYGSWRHQDSALGFLQTLAGYALVVQVARLVAFRWRVAASGGGAWPRVFLVGALFGWLVEGVLVTTVVKIVPFSFSYTGLAWHALFTVLLGWWWMPRQLTRPLLRSVGPIVAVGAGAGAWASFWKFSHRLEIPVFDYALFALVTTALYAAGLAVWWAFRTRSNPGLRGSAAAIAVLGVIAVLHAVSNPLTLLGPALVGLALLAIILTAPSGTDDPLLPTAGPAPWRSLWRLVLIPIAATAVFALIGSAPVAVVTGWIFVIVTALLGAAFFVIAWWRSRRARA
jgi:hypothetical protein